MALILASVLAHRGKHGPLLLTRNHQLPDSIEKYLKTVQPSYTGTREQLFNNAWVIGENTDTSVIKKINSLLEIKHLSNNYRQEIIEEIFISNNEFKINIVY